MYLKFLGLLEKPFNAAIDGAIKYYAGFLRGINILADHYLLFGFANQARRIGRSLVDAAIEYTLSRSANVDAGGVNTLSRSAVGCRTE